MKYAEYRCIKCRKINEEYPYCFIELPLDDPTIDSPRGCYYVEDLEEAKKKNLPIWDIYRTFEK